MLLGQTCPLPAARLQLGSGETSLPLPPLLTPLQVPIATPSSTPGRRAEEQADTVCGGGGSGADSRRVLSRRGAQEGKTKRL